ncbi:MAG: hypothetical protein ACC628_08690 [Pirellulaceae bacterium]
MWKHGAARQQILNLLMGQIKQIIRIVQQSERNQFATDGHRDNNALGTFICDRLYVELSVEA